MIKSYKLFIDAMIYECFYIITPVDFIQRNSVTWAPTVRDSDVEPVISYVIKVCIVYHELRGGQRIGV